MRIMVLTSAREASRMDISNNKPTSLKEVSTNNSKSLTQAMASRLPPESPKQLHPANSNSNLKKMRDGDKMICYLMINSL